MTLVVKFKPVCETANSPNYHSQMNKFTWYLLLKMISVKSSFGNRRGGRRFRKKKIIIQNVKLFGNIILCSGTCLVESEQ